MYFLYGIMIILGLISTIIAIGYFLEILLDTSWGSFIYCVSNICIAGSLFYVSDVMIQDVEVCQESYEILKNAKSCGIDTSEYTKDNLLTHKEWYEIRRKIKIKEYQQ